jgi:hypothetical protein
MLTYPAEAGAASDVHRWVRDKGVKGRGLQNTKSEGLVSTLLHYLRLMAKGGAWARQKLGDILTLA